MYCLALRVTPRSPLSRYPAATLSADAVLVEDDAVTTTGAVSTRTLVRRVKAQTGDSPLALLQQARVDKGKQLLNDSGWSIAQITEAVGYADVPTLSSLFANRLGGPESPP